MRPLALLALAACATDPGDSADSAEAEPTTATLELSFVMDPDLIPEMAEAPAGTFQGSIYAEDDATGFGPDEGAVSLLDFESSALDLSADGGPSAVAFSGGELDPQIIWILGCLDSDADDCECGDPITHPNDNKVEIVVGPNPLSVKMELLHPCD